MCGIAGAWGLNNKNLDVLALSKAMRASLSHRGPDSFGDWHDANSNIAISHSRLSIIDLSDTGHQPMVSKNKRYILSFNGEIYNHLELRKIVNERFSYNHWNGTSDIESFLTHLEFFGLKETLNISKGMFSFALWDQQENELNLVRDRFGEKPLYWFFEDDIEKGVLIFASELVAFKEFKNFNYKIKNESLKDFLTKGYINAPDSIYKNVYQLEPGCILSLKSKLNCKKFFDLNDIQIEKWWDNRTQSEVKKINVDNSTNNSYSLNEIVNLVEKKIQDSVVLASNADVPLCCFLSGGVDSSLISLMLQKNRNLPINTVNIAFEESGLGESSFNEDHSAKLVSSYLGSNHTSIILSSKDIQEIIPKLATIYNEPFSDSSQLPTVLLCKLARELGYKVALCGDGGDELFGGYNRHNLLPKINHIFKYVPPNILSLLSKGINIFPVKNNYLNFDKRQKLSKLILNANSVEKMYNNLINLNSYTNKLINLENDYDYYIKLPKSSNISEQIMLADLEHYLPSDLLVKIDRAAMSFGLETRAPFLDYELVKFAWKLPTKMKIRNGKGKWILRKILSKYFPEEIYKKPKSGFSVPLGVWIRGPLKTWVYDLLSEETIRKQGFLDYKEVSFLLEQHINLQKDNTSILWSILMWQLWLMHNKI